MNINDLTIGQAKELAGMFGGKCESASVASSAVGKYVIVRSRNEGLNFGKVVAADETGVVLAEAVRLWYHKPKDQSASWYEGVAKFGASPECKVSVAVDQKVIVEDYSMTVCSEGVEESIKSLVPHAQN